MRSFIPQGENIRTNMVVFGIIIIFLIIAVIIVTTMPIEPTHTNVTITKIFNDLISFG